MKLRKGYQSLIFLILFLTSVFHGSSLVGAQQLTDINVAPPNPEFLNYLDSLKAAHLLQQPSEHGLGLIPSPVDLSHLQGTIPFEGVMSLGFPSTYDLRTSGNVTPIRNQGACGSCWAFATYGSLESNLMPSESSDFSENSLKNAHGFDLASCSGGNAFMSTAYLARWDGPVSESDDPYNPGGISPSGLSERKHVQEVLIIPDRQGPSDNDNIKQAVMNYGALYTTMYWSDVYYSSTNAAYYYNGSSTNHAVAIVGWDDNFDRYKFPSLPPGNGAFIIRNSWGPSFGKNGYFYISYYDARIGAQNFLFIDAEPISNYRQVYQYDPLGWVGDVGYGNNTAWFSNVFTANSNDPLGAVSFYTASLNSTYEIYIYTNVTSTPTSGSLAASKAGAIQFPGYHTLDMDAPVPLTSGQHFSVVVKLTTPGNNFPIPYEGPYAGYSSHATANPGESYISSNGASWTDLTSLSWCSECNVCLKAFTSRYSTIGVYRPSNSTCYLKSSNSTGTLDIEAQYGVFGDFPIMGDWTGKGYKSIGIFRPTTGNFFMRNTNTTGPADITVIFGQPGDIAVVGDWTRKGYDSIGVFRPSTGQFLLRNTNTTGPADIAVTLGKPGDWPVAGDWTGKGYDSVGIHRPATGKFFLRNTNTTGPADITLVMGKPGDMPVAGDWTGKGYDSIGIFRPATGKFFLRNTNTTGPADITVIFGQPGDMPVAW